MSESVEAKKTSRFTRIKAEFKKIIWPTKGDVRKQTTAVVCTSVVLAAVIALLDLVFKYGINFIIGIGA